MAIMYVINGFFKVECELCKEIGHNNFSYSNVHLQSESGVVLYHKAWRFAVLASHVRC